ncbi:glycoside hydrolase/deacetylase [Neoconidiobolus thromboides FSU 785]|nr:glycoside hydrolase/deacetylase [Neoconidiobolus thromboides FSU 785]
MLLLYIICINLHFILSIVYQSCSKNGDLALTFDGGPSPYTGRLLNLLKDKEVKVTFHLSGEYLNTPFVKAYVQQAYQDGHLIGLQCKEDLFKVDSNNSTFFDRLTDLQNNISKLINYKPYFLRVPYSSNDFPKEIVDKLESMGFILSISNLDTQDYLYANVTSPDNDNIFLNFKNQLDQIIPPSKGSFISTQHDIVQASINQTPKIIDYLKDRGYTPVTISECVQENKSDKEVGKDKSKKKDTKDKGDEQTNKEDNNKVENSKVKSDAIGLKSHFLLFTMMAIVFI